MPVTSYLAWAEKHVGAALEGALRSAGGCEVIPSDRAGVFIVVADTPD